MNIYIIDFLTLFTDKYTPLVGRLQVRKLQAYGFFITGLCP